MEAVELTKRGRPSEREIVKRALMEASRWDEGITKWELHKKTGLSRPTVNRHLNHFMADGKVIWRGAEGNRNPKGRLFFWESVHAEGKTEYEKRVMDQIKRLFEGPLPSVEEFIERTSEKVDKIINIYVDLALKALNYIPKDKWGVWMNEMWDAFDKTSLVLRVKSTPSASASEGP